MTEMMNPIKKIYRKVFDAKEDVYIEERVEVCPICKKKI